MTNQPNMKEMMEMAQKMQQSMKDAHEQLLKMNITGEAGGGMVKIVMNGRHDVKQVIIEPNAMAEGRTVLQDLIAAAVNDANRKVEKASQEKMLGLTKELGLPEDFGGTGTAA